MTREQKKTVRRALRQYGRGTLDADAGEWARAIERTMDYYAREDPVCAALLRLRYLERRTEAQVTQALYIGRTTYYHKELEALSTLSTFAAGLGLM